MKNSMAAMLFLLVSALTAFGRNPVIFVHGFTGSAQSYETIMASLVLDYKWQYGGELTLDRKTGEIISGQAAVANVIPPRAGDFYLMDFSDYQDLYPSQNLDLWEQATELEKIVQKVLKLTGKPQVTLVGHSMGALAVRAYLQFHQATNVEQAIFIAGPHQGSEIALLEEVALARFLVRKFRKEINPKSKAIQLLKPTSEELRELNDFLRFPLPKNTKLSCLVIEGGSIAEESNLLMGNSDGVVTVRSQDLTQVVGAEQLSPQKIFRFYITVPSNLEELIPIPAHNLALQEPNVLNTILDIIHETFPRVILENKSRDLRLGEILSLSLANTPPNQLVLAKGWLDEKPLSPNYWSAGTTSTTGAFRFTSDSILQVGVYDIQFQVAGKASNCERIFVTERLPLQLELGYALTKGEAYSIVIRLTRLTNTKGQNTVFLAGHADKSGEFTIPDLPVRARAGGALEGSFSIPKENTLLLAQVKVNEEWSNIATLEFRQSRLLFSMPDAVFTMEFPLKGFTMELLQPQLTLAFVGTEPMATFGFPQPVACFWAAILAKTDLVILATPQTGPEYEFRRLSKSENWQQLLILDQTGFSKVSIKAVGAGPPFWTLTDLMLFSRLDPPLLIAGFDKNPIPKGEKTGGGWWRNLIFLAQPDDVVPVRLEKIDFWFFDASGRLFLRQTETKEDFIKKNWFQRDPASLSLIGLCPYASRDNEGNLWLMGKGAICQELVYGFEESPKEPRFVQMRFAVQDLFGTKQSITASAVMLP